ncbi:hypothetical protein A6D6_01401 [Alcanivorax xiamenensis]|uniref:Uncharacterized protein n=1 Tax=Alcanivorax xiamenensis TaxID=1177156 RepID=A0ABQ6YA85_9GAMM|nr:hypothetical protein A6D6_01401 [Alcanivorax xiamenensis]
MMTPKARGYLRPRVTKPMEGCPLFPCGFGAGALVREPVAGLLDHWWAALAKSAIMEGDFLIFSEHQEST